MGTTRASQEVSLTAHEAIYQSAFNEILSMVIMKNYSSCRFRVSGIGKGEGIQGQCRESRSTGRDGTWGRNGDGTVSKGRRAHILV